ncbi:hypothetical protein [Sphingorhabdus sp. EL138]|uniref:hypothetical protein n=1 Tax=Sphingorhabdus sp. EL138 TaxID=2073156 RepID=UPI0013A5A8A7|nr:hypothetical protein [Sphingorhabdus sp. EL138]
MQHNRLHHPKTAAPGPGEAGWAARATRKARRGQAHLQGCNEVKDPVLKGRVAADRGGPSRERRPPRLVGAGKQRRRTRAVHINRYPLL